jgi:DNA-binding GntR family transcriptional regulator
LAPYSESLVTQSDKTFAQLRNAIVEGEVASGSKLSESELSAKYSVSRAVIREAINRLVACHLVERKSNVGARVVTLSAKALIELYQLRESLEGMAARLAANMMSDEEIADLKLLLANHLNMMASKDSYYQQAGDVDFHYRIIIGSKNQHLINILIDGIYHLVRMYRVQYGMSGPRISTAFEEHKNIAQAIENRDAELAEMLMRRHISYTSQALANKLSTDIV